MTLPEQSHKAIDKEQHETCPDNELMEEDETPNGTAVVTSETMDRELWQTRTAAPANINPDDDDEVDQQWMTSCFAVGLTKPTWKDENRGCLETCEACLNGSPRTHILCTALICSKCPTGRVGNMIILHETTETYTENDNSTQHRRRRLRWMLGPFWICPVCITFPGVAAYAAFAGYRKEIWDQPTAWFCLWIVFNCLALVSLFLVACSDPGIQYRYNESPEESWRWNDQALTFRPNHARFDPECGVVIEHFDHTCLWTGTGIGGNNMRWFRIFVPSIFMALILDTVILAYLPGLVG